MERALHLLLWVSFQRKNRIMSLPGIRCRAGKKLQQKERKLYTRRKTQSRESNSMRLHQMLLRNSLREKKLVIFLKESKKVTSDTADGEKKRRRIKGKLPKNETELSNRVETLTGKGYCGSSEDTISKNGEPGKEKKNMYVSWEKFKEETSMLIV